MVFYELVMFFFNLDETKWNNINVSLTTIHLKGEHSKVNIYGDEKESFTIAIIISYSGMMLTPILIAKGKTNRCLKKYDLDNSKIIGTYSNNGWINYGIIKIAFDEIHKITKGKPSCLLLDAFPSHTGEFIKNEADIRNIQLIYVPSGLTYKYQPLDVLINGILKQKAKTEWRKEVTKNPNMKIKSSDSVKHFLNAKEEITSEIITRSFDKSCFAT